MVRVAPGGGARKGGGIAARLGVKGGVAIGDARHKINQATRAKTSDARDILSANAKGMDARQKLERLRNLKEGKLEVKKIGSGGITMTKKVDGKISLSTKSAGKQSKTVPENKEVKQIGRLTKTISSSGQVTLSSKSLSGTGSGSSMRSRSEGRGGPEISGKSRPQSGGGGILRGTGASRQKENMRGGRDLDRLDDELLNAQVDPLLLKRTIEVSRSKVSGGGRRGQSEGRGRSRSPILGRSGGMAGLSLRDRSPVGRGSRGGYDDYDDPRALSERENEVFRRRMRDQEQDQEDISIGRTLGSGGAIGISPLQGTKIVIKNLQTSVSQEDILELFGDIGALRRAKLVTPGHAEVTFVNKSDAARAVEIYHNRQLDGKPMKCQLVGSNSVVASGGATMKLPPSLSSSRRKEGSNSSAPAPDLDSIHRALFFNKKATGKKPLFTITMPKKSEDEERW